MGLLEAAALSSIEVSLDPKRFLLFDRLCMVNLERVAKIEP
jgi:hypothetical protein